MRSKEPGLGEDEPKQAAPSLQRAPFSIRDEPPWGRGNPRAGRLLPRGGSRKRGWPHASPPGAVPGAQDPPGELQPEAGTPPLLSSCSQPLYPPGGSRQRQPKPRQRCHHPPAPSILPPPHTHGVTPAREDPRVPAHTHLIFPEAAGAVTGRGEVRVWGWGWGGRPTRPLPGQLGGGGSGRPLRRPGHVAGSLPAALRVCERVCVCVGGCERV